MKPKENLEIYENGVLVATIYDINEVKIRADEYDSFLMVLRVSTRHKYFVIGYSEETSFKIKESL